MLPQEGAEITGVFLLIVVIGRSSKRALFIRRGANETCAMGMLRQLGSTASLGGRKKFLFALKRLEDA